MIKVSEQTYFSKKINVILIALLCTILWGTACPAIKIGFELFEIGQNDIFTQMLFAGLRFTLAGIFAMIVPCSREKKIVMPSKNLIIDVVLIGLIQTTLQYIFFYIGLSNTTGFKASVLTALSTFFSVGIAHLVYKEDRLTVMKSIGCVIGFIGVMIMSLGKGSGDSGGFNLLGDGFVVLSLLAFAVTCPMCKEAGKKGDIITITGHSLIIGGVVLIAIGLLGGGSLNNITPLSVLILLYLSLLSATAVTLWNILLKYNNVGMVSVYNFFVPIFGTIFSAIFLHEQVFSVKNLLALILTCIGIFVVNKEPVKDKPLVVQPIE